MSVNCDRCGRFTSESSGEYDFCSDCWYAPLHRYGPGWWEIRREALKRDNYRCQDCGLSNSEAKDEYGEELSVHHIEPFEEGGDHSLDNLVTLCKSCHMSREQKT